MFLVFEKKHFFWGGTEMEISENDGGGIDDIQLSFVQTELNVMNAAAAAATAIKLVVTVMMRMNKNR